jgi:AraC-like DNA-binding protein
MGPSELPEIQYEVNGLSSMHEVRDGTAQPRPHSHNEIEVLLIEQGSGVWLMGGDLVTLKPGSLILFWAIRPHQLIKSSPKLVIDWLNIPLTVFIEWQLSESFTQMLLSGKVVMEPDKSWFAFDKKAFANWHLDLKSPNPDRQKLALLEIEARLGRMAVEVRGGDAQEQARDIAPVLLNHSYFGKISQIADYVSKNFTEPLTVADIAKTIGMHPTSATKLFKKVCGMNLMHYLTQHRIFHAQRLLSSTDMKILDVALESGYQSASRFYAAFKEFCGASPQEFRKSFDITKLPLQRHAGVFRTQRSRVSGDTQIRFPVK